MGSFLEKLFEYRGLPCVVLMTPLGHRCGYVGIQKDHPCYGLDTNETCFLPGHGGITWAESYVDHEFVKDKDLADWWFGFDCAHLGDIPDFGLAIERWPENVDIYLMNMRCAAVDPHATVMTEERVTVSVKDLADELYYIGKNGLSEDQKDSLEYERHLNELYDEK